MESDVDAVDLLGSSVAFDMPDLLTGVFRYLGVMDKVILRGVRRSWYSVMKSAQVNRIIHIDSPCQRRAIHRYLLSVSGLGSRLTTMVVRCNSGRDEWFRDILRYSTYTPARLEALVVYGGDVCSIDLVVAVLIHSGSPRILLRKTVLRGMVFGNRRLDDMKVFVKYGVLDPDSMANVVLADDEELRWMGVDQLDKAIVLVSDLMASVLDNRPLPCSEDDVLTKSKDIPQFLMRYQVRTALRVLDPGCFKPEWAEPLADIVIPKSTLRNATMHVIFTIWKNCQRPPCLWENPHCCRLIPDYLYA